MQSLTVELVAYEMRGTATIRCWDDGVATVRMTPRRLPLLLKQDALADAINDGGFGAEAVLLANYEIWGIYERGVEQILWDGVVDNPIDLLYAKRG